MRSDSWRRMWAPRSPRQGRRRKRRAPNVSAWSDMGRMSTDMFPLSRSGPPLPIAWPPVARDSPSFPTRRRTGRRAAANRSRRLSPALGPCQAAMSKSSTPSTRRPPVGTDSHVAPGLTCMDAYRLVEQSAPNACMSSMVIPTYSGWTRPPVTVTRTASRAYGAAINTPLVN